MRRHCSPRRTPVWVAPTATPTSGDESRTPKADSRSTAAPATATSRSSTTRASTARRSSAATRWPRPASAATARTASSRIADPAAPDQRDEHPAAVREAATTRGRRSSSRTPSRRTHPRELQREHPRRGAVQEGPAVTAVCTSCHTAHHRPAAHRPALLDLERPDRQDLHEVPRPDRARAPQGDPGRAVGEAAPHDPRLRRLPQPAQGPQGLLHPGHGRPRLHELPLPATTCTSTRGLESAKLKVDPDELEHSRHARVGVRPVPRRTAPRPWSAPARRWPPKVDCSVCHAAGRRPVQDRAPTASSPPGEPGRAGLQRLPRHARHPRQDRHQVDHLRRGTFPTLCGKCHRKGQKAAVRYKGTEHGIVEHYTESIHGKGLLESGLTVTATCADCHTAHGELPRSRSRLDASTATNIAQTCAQCHRGIYELFDGQHPLARRCPRSDKKLPVCSDCHSAHSIQRTDLTDFRLHIMDQCGNCHEEIAESYFDTYHGKVSKLGYVKTAKCYDCHGAHDILPVWNPQSHLSRANIVKTCGQCHPGSNRRFAGYLTHATHHDPNKYPFLFYTFWGMTALLVGTFTVAGLHTLAWLPRSLQYPARAASDARDRESAQLRAPLHAVLPQPAPDGDRQLPRPRPHRHDAEVLLRRLGAGLSRVCSAASRPPARPPRLRPDHVRLLRPPHLGPAAAQARRSRRDWRSSSSARTACCSNLTRPARSSSARSSGSSGTGPAAGLRPLDLLGEVRLLRRVLGRGVIGVDRAAALVPGVLHADPARLAAQRRHHHPQRRGAARGRLHLHHPLLQHPLPPGEVPDGHGDLHRPRAARGVQARPAPPNTRSWLRAAAFESHRRAAIGTDAPFLARLRVTALTIGLLLIGLIVYAVLFAYR